MTALWPPKKDLLEDPQNRRFYFHEKDIECLSFGPII
jgi:hypothetical protein